MTSGNTITGQISTAHSGFPGINNTRQAELAGPRLRSASSGGGYIPWVHTAETTGVYKVEFISGLGESTTDEGSTWLRVLRIPPAVDSVKIIGYNGTEGHGSNKGGASGL